MKKVLFIDRDGTMLEEPEDEQVDSLEKFRFIPGAITGLARIAAETDFELVMVTNQDGLGTPSFPEETFWPSHNKMISILEGEGVRFSAKGIDLENSYVIGDRVTDVEFAKNLGCNAIYFNSQKSTEAVLSSCDWHDIYRFLKLKPRVASIERKTKETDIRLELNIDGTGKSNISTGIEFFDHMLDQMARHGSFDLIINATGDKGIDGHHLIEDLAICLGEAFLKAAGSKKGIERYSFVLPMDDCLAQVAVDMGGRPWLVWKADFSYQKIGEMPTEMFYHFFKSFSDSAKCNLNISAEGSNEHHKIEAIFKAFARALKNALKQTDNFSLPSTKGKL
jgi:imidazoleglycerol-phosphate dehydratase/histidinol-phosphatase